MVDGRKDTALGLGERLRSARKARALTLAQAAFTLRLEEPVLRALEDERYEVLGAAVFVRGHLKAYARLLGLSEEAVLTAYRASDPNADTPPKVTRELEKPLTTSPGTAAILAAVGFSVLAILLLYMLSTGDEPAQPASGAVPVTPPTVETVPFIELTPLPDTAPAPAAGTDDPATDGSAAGSAAVPPESSAQPGVAPAPAAAPPAATEE